MIGLIKDVYRDLKEVQKKDPSANNMFLVFLFWPGFNAVFLYRIYSRLWKLKILRLFSYFLWRISSIINSVDIHPAAKIGKAFVIDHGVGVVIGATSVIGDRCLLYQGVTLGALKPFKDAKNQKKIKRHPTLGNDVVVGAYAVILGDINIATKVMIPANKVIVDNVELKNKKTSN